MKKNFSGNILFLNKSDINTDEIIPAKYLTEVTKESLTSHLLEDLVLEGFSQDEICGKQVVVTRDNFGCGSSREHAAWVFEMNGINTIIGEGYSRIFRQNMFNCGMLCITLPQADLDKVFADFGNGCAEALVDLENSSVTITNGSIVHTFGFTLDGFDKALIDAGGWVNYADSHY